MAYQKESLNLEMKEVVFVKPSNPISSSILSLSDFDHRTDCNGMGQIIFVYQSSNINSPNNNKVDPFFVIKEALSKALLYYYPLAGRLVENGDGKLNIHLEPNHGVPLVEAIANCHLSSLQYLDGNDVEIAKKLAFDLPLQDKNGHQYPLVMKVTKFLCGGFTIGLGISHVVCDGVGVAQFYKAMSEVASGKSEPSIKPVWERECVLVGSINKEPFQDPMGIDTAAISPYLPTSDLVHGCIKVNGEVIRRLRMSLINECTNDNTKKENITALDSLMPYIWRSRARALNQSCDGKTRLSIMTGVRKFFVDPPFPKGYYGNAVVDVYVVLTVKELNEKPLLEIAKVINMSKKDGSNSDYIKKSLNTIYPSLDDFNHESGAVVSLTDWRHLGYLEMGDLAGNKLVNVVPAPCNLFGMVDLIIFTPPSKLDSSMKEGVRIFTSLPSVAMLKFIEEINTLNNIIDQCTTQTNWWPNAKL